MQIMEKDRQGLVVPQRTERELRILRNVPNAVRASGLFTDEAVMRELRILLARYKGDNHERQ